MWLAHSADKKNSIPAQDYAAHINGVVGYASRAANDAARYAKVDGDVLRSIVSLASEYHDLGKLDVENQEVLSGRRKALHLPVQHTDAGTAYLLDNLQNALSATLVRSHHIGLPDFVEEQNRGDKALRDDVVLERVNQTLDELLKHHNELRQPPDAGITGGITGNSTLFFRIALSCLADGDHTDTSIHYGDPANAVSEVLLRPSERLTVLNNYVDSLKANNARSRTRSDVYEFCRDIDTSVNIVSCDSPVGTGKTTAVMAHLLSQAKKRGLRRIIVVLPFTNIITQSVDVYRKALVLAGEDPALVVAELHHRAEFSDVHSRQFTALWRAPIIVTTAVAFFETLASNTPSTMRRLHNLPGSAVFIDESHAALPAKLLPLAWRWIKSYANEWNCYWVLASGSLSRFWKIEEFDQEMPDIPEIIFPSLGETLQKYECERINYCHHQAPLSASELVQWALTLPGPRLLIVNTVQSAAVIAREFERQCGMEKVEHISTALMAKDRVNTLDRVKSRLGDDNDSNWTLVATSCVEAGVDLSFKTGIREAASLVSLLQTAGRVNRHGMDKHAKVWTFRFTEEGLLKSHPGFRDATRVLMDLISSNAAISQSLCTEALKREIRLGGFFKQALMDADDHMQYPQVERNFRVIPTDTRIVIVDRDLIEKLENHRSVGWHEIQMGSVLIWGYRLDELRIPEISGRPGVYKWIYNYDNFVGYMAGILPVEAFKQGNIDSCIV